MVLKDFVSGEVLFAADLNGNFDELETGIEATRVAGNNIIAFSVFA